MATNLTSKQLRNAASQLGSRGGRATAKRLTPAERSEIAKRAAQARWAKAKPLAGAGS